MRRATVGDALRRTEWESPPHSVVRGMMVSALARKAQTVPSARLPAAAPTRRRSPSCASWGRSASLAAPETHARRPGAPGKASEGSSLSRRRVELSRLMERPGRGACAALRAPRRLFRSGEAGRLKGDGVRRIDGNRTAVESMDERFAVHDHARVPQVAIVAVLDHHRDRGHGRVDLDHSGRALLEQAPPSSPLRHSDRRARAADSRPAVSSS